MIRDFTFISDIINGIFASICSVPKKHLDWDGSLSSSSAAYRILNLGNNKPVNLLDFIYILEQELGVKANLHFAELQDGDVLKTWADLEITQREIKYNPKVEIKEGLKIFIEWFKNYYKYEARK
jgi:UDP-glucuronate 4-epimerase